MMTLGTFAGSISYPWDGLAATEYVTSIAGPATSGNSSAYSSVPNIGTYTSGRIVLIRACVNFTNCTCTVGGESTTRLASRAETSHLFLYTGTLNGSQTITVTGDTGGNYANIYYHIIKTKYQSGAISVASNIVSSGVVSASPSQGAENGILWAFANQQSSVALDFTNSTSTTMTSIADAPYNNGAYRVVEKFYVIPANSPNPIITSTDTTGQKQLITAVFR